MWLLINFILGYIIGYIVSKTQEDNTVGLFVYYAHVRTLLADRLTHCSVPRRGSPEVKAENHHVGKLLKELRMFKPRREWSHISFLQTLKGYV